MEWSACDGLQAERKSIRTASTQLCSTIDRLLPCHGSPYINEKLVEKPHQIRDVCKSRYLLFQLIFCSFCVCIWSARQKKCLSLSRILTLRMDSVSAVANELCTLRDWAMVFVLMICGTCTLAVWHWINVCVVSYLLSFLCALFFCIVRSATTETILLPHSPAHRLFFLAVYFVLEVARVCEHLCCRFLSLSLLMNIELHEWTGVTGSRCG